MFSNPAAPVSIQNGCRTPFPPALPRLRRSIIGNMPTPGPAFRFVSAFAPTPGPVFRYASAPTGYGNGALPIMQFSGVNLPPFAMCGNINMQPGSTSSWEPYSYKPGEYVMANLNGQWLWATVSAVNQDSISVLFVDYETNGSYEVSFDEIRSQEEHQTIIDQQIQHFIPIPVYYASSGLDFEQKVPSTKKGGVPKLPESPDTVYPAPVSSLDPERIDYSQLGDDSVESESPPANFPLLIPQHEHYDDLAPEMPQGGFFLHVELAGDLQRGDRVVVSFVGIGDGNSVVSETVTMTENGVLTFPSTGNGIDEYGEYCITYEVNGITYRGTTRNLSGDFDSNADAYAEINLAVVDERRKVCKKDIVPGVIEHNKTLWNGEYKDLKDDVLDVDFRSSKVVQIRFKNKTQLQMCNKFNNALMKESKSEECNYQIQKVGLVTSDRTMKSGQILRVGVILQYVLRNEREVEEFCQSFQQLQRKVFGRRKKAVLNLWLYNNDEQWCKVVTYNHGTVSKV